MEYLFYLPIFIASFLGTEVIARLTHKHIMHGFLWSLHKDHHLNPPGVLENNDWFSFIFSIPSFFCIYLGLKYNYFYFVCIGAGMASYGLAYFLVHDVYIHQRIKLLKNFNNAYLKGIKRAHKIHHKNLKKENAESFGFLIVEKKYFQQADKNNLL